jgi:hypothetical protein
MTRRFTQLAATALAVLSVGALAAQSSTAATITGFSDQEIGRSDPAVGEWSTTVRAWADQLPQVTQARYNVAWDVALQPPTNRAVVDLVNWLNATAARGMRPLISFMPSGGATPSVADYTLALQHFRIQWPQVTEFTAWNEPDHSGETHLPEATAVDFLRAATSICGSSCTVAAGDFAGGDAGYVTTYYGLLGTLRPSAWAYHPYGPVNDDGTNRFARLDAFLGTIGSDKDVWFTEVGAYFCRDNRLYGAASQNAAAGRLRDLLADPVRARQVSRVYYYHLAGNWRPPDPSVGERCNWDSGLVGTEAWDGAAPRPALYTLFPQLRGRWWASRDANSGGPLTRSLVFSAAGTPVAGDWNGDGLDTPGAFLNGTWWQRSAPGSGGPDNAFAYGDIGHKPIVGDWNHDGVDTPGVFNPVDLGWHLRDANSAGSASASFLYGFADGNALSGDWDGDGDDTIGIYRPSNQTFYLRNDNSAGIADITVQYGFPGGVPVVGDWDGDRHDTIGMFNPADGSWYLRNDLRPGIAERTFYFGGPGDTPVVGDWNNDNIDTVGVVR